MLTKLLLVPLFAIILFSVSCATLPYEPYAREVKKRPSDGGTIALNGVHRPEDRARAEMLMKSNCGTSETKVVEEGEVVVGEKTDATAHKSASTYNDNAFKIGAMSFGNSRPSDKTDTTTHTTQLKEWHISYQCVAATNTTTPVAKKSRTKRK